jgi:isochorismate synthase
LIQVWYKFPNDTVIHHINGEASLVLPDNAFVMMPFLGENPIYLPLDSEEIVSLEEIVEVSFSLPKSPVIASIDYEKIVEDGIIEINAGSFDKVVLARQKEIEYNDSPIAIFKRLCAEYQNCFVHLVYEENKWCSIGASPELLLKANNDKIKSVSMAGTVAGDTPNFSQKEKEEQQFVTDYILEIFSDFKLKTQIRDEVIKNGDINHLYTIIESTKTVSDKETNALLDKLHPTPAVGGYPKLPAINFINTHEGFNREWYAGYLGVQSKTDIETYVNLRCAKLYDKAAIMYAGAGITKDSNPNDELEETESKLRVLGAFLK